MSKRGINGGAAHWAYAFGVLVTVAYLVLNIYRRRWIKTSTAAVGVIGILVLWYRYHKHGE